MVEDSHVDSVVLFATLKKSSEADPLEVNTWHSIQGLGQLENYDTREESTKLPGISLNIFYLPASPTLWSVKCSTF